MQANRFFALPISGFAGKGSVAEEQCESLSQESVLGISSSGLSSEPGTDSIDLLRQHSVFKALNGTKSHRFWKNKASQPSWTQEAGPSLWLPHQQVFLAVTKISYHEHKDQHWPRVSWLRGQIHDKNWRHLINHTIVWKDHPLTFPTILDIPFDFDNAGHGYGPESPRLTFEDSAEDAEPILVYNARAKNAGWRHATFIHRVFSSRNKMMTLTGRNNNETDKNWLPLITQSEGTGIKERQEPDQYLHLVDDRSPLRVIRCSTKSGNCDDAFDRNTSHSGALASVHGGTNWMPVPATATADTPSSVQAWALFTGSESAKFCGDRFYRPQLAVMVKLEEEFRLAFVSEPIDFASALVSLKPGDDPCAKSRILLPKSIARWHVVSGDQDGQATDVMDITLSATGGQNQILHLQGLMDLIRKLPLLSNHTTTQQWIETQSTRAASLYAQDDQLIECSLAGAIYKSNTTRLLTGPIEHNYEREGHRNNKEPFLSNVEEAYGIAHEEPESKEALEDDTAEDTIDEDFGANSQPKDASSVQDHNRMEKVLESRE